MVHNLSQYNCVAFFFFDLLRIIKIPLLPTLCLYKKLIFSPLTSFKLLWKIWWKIFFNRDFHLSLLILVMSIMKSWKSTTDEKSTNTKFHSNFLFKRKFIAMTLKIFFFISCLCSTMPCRSQVTIMSSNHIYHHSFHCQNVHYL